MRTREIYNMNIVLVIGNIDTSIFNQYWFIVNNVYGPEEIENTSIFSPGVTKIFSNDSILLITPQTIQFTIRDNDILKAYEVIKKRFLKMLSKAPLIPFRAIGLNFMWKIVDSSLDLHTLSKDCFYNQENRLFAYFSNGDAGYGVYLSQNYDAETRLKLDIKPVILNGGIGTAESLLASFNYHRDLNGSNDTPHVIAQLQKWSNIAANSKKICSLI